MAAQAELFGGEADNATALEYMNVARKLAAERAAYAIEMLGRVMQDTEYDMDTRVNAAAEILQFLARGTF